MKRLMLLFTFVLTQCVFLSPGHARVVYFGSETETIPLVYEDQTLFKFPAEVKTISKSKRFEIAPANTDQPSFAVLSVKAKFPSGSNEVVFILGDGTTIKTRLVVVPKAIPEKTDSLYEFRSKDTLVRSDSGSKPGSNLSEIELMKAMIRGDEVAGYEARSLVRTIRPGFLGLDTKLVRIYTGNQFNGYVFELVNITKDQKLLINVQNLILGDPNVALLSSIDNSVLEPEGSQYQKTYLRVVAKPTSLYNEIILPVQVVEAKEGRAEQ